MRPLRIILGIICAYASRATADYTGYTWTDTTSSWTTPTAWSPQSGDWTNAQRLVDSAVFFNSQKTIANQPNLDNNVNVNYISIDDSQANWSISSSFGALNIGSGGIYAYANSGGGASTISASVNLSQPQTWLLDTVDMTVTGAFSGPVAFNKNGRATLYLTNNANSYTGPISIAQGTISVSSMADGGTNSALGAASSDPSNLVFNGTSATLAYTGAGDSTNRLFTMTPFGATINSIGTGPLKFTSTASLAYTGSTARTLNLQANTASGTNVMAIPIADGPGGATSVVVSGGGTWLLSGNSTYTGSTQVTDGTVIVQGNRPLATGPIVGNGGAIRLADKAVIGGDVGFQATQAGTAATMTNSPQFFGDSEEATIMGNVTMGQNAVIEFEIQGPDPESGYDQAEIGGNITIDGALLDPVVDGYTPFIGETFFLFNDMGSNPVTGQFANAPEGSVISADGYHFQITYFADSSTGSLTGGNGIALTAVVPEPVTPLALLAIPLLRFRRSRKPLVDGLPNLWRMESRTLRTEIATDPQRKLVSQVRIGNR